jgi:hypothetical protein
MTPLKPWADGPFELIVHAELHMRDGSDFDRRMALISLDNAIEVAITTYLLLHPIQRQNLTYARADIDRWLDNYHTKIEFFFEEVARRAVTVVCERDGILWCHDVRNGQYHGGGPTIPRARELADIRRAALEVFSVLFGVPDAEDRVSVRVEELMGNDLPKRDGAKDKLIDVRHGMVHVAGMPYYTSELIYGVDPFAYGNLAAELEASDAESAEGTEESQ